MKNIATIIVLYNSLISDSKAYKSLNDPRLDLFFIDNSTEEAIKQENQKFAQSQKVNYLDMGGNVGLSKAYNRVIDQLKANYDYNYILLCDDDTEFTSEFIDKLWDATKTQEYDLIVPTILDGLDKVVASPILLTKIPLVKYKEGSKRPPAKIEGINSGSCIHLRAFDNWRYNEDIFLYFVDTYFYRFNVNKNKLKYKILDCTIIQNFSSSEEFSEKSLARLRLVLKDARPYFKTQNFWRIKLFLYKILLIVRLYGQHHDKRLFQIMKY